MVGGMVRQIMPPVICPLALHVTTPSVVVTGRYPLRHVYAQLCPSLMATHAPPPSQEEVMEKLRNDANPATLKMRGRKGMSVEGRLGRPCGGGGSPSAYMPAEPHVGPLPEASRPLYTVVLPKAAEKVNRLVTEAVKENHWPTVML